MGRELGRDRMISAARQPVSRTRHLRLVLALRSGRGKRRGVSRPFPGRSPTSLGRCMLLFTKLCFRCRLIGPSGHAWRFSPKCIRSLNKSNGAGIEFCVTPTTRRKRRQGTAISRLAGGSGPRASQRPSHYPFAGFRGLPSR